MLLWETFSIGTPPYAGMDDESVLSKVYYIYSLHCVIGACLNENKLHSVSHGVQTV